MRMRLNLSRRLRESSFAPEDARNPARRLTFASGTRSAAAAANAASAPTSAFSFAERCGVELKGVRWG